MKPSNEHPLCLLVNEYCHCLKHRGHGGSHECLCSRSWPVSEDDNNDFFDRFMKRVLSHSVETTREEDEDDE